MEFGIVSYATLVVAVLYALYRRFTRPSLKDIRGPPPESFMMGMSILRHLDSRLSLTGPCLGNLRDLFQFEVGASDFKWQKEYGNVVRLATAIGVSRLNLIQMYSEPYMRPPSRSGRIPLRFGPQSFTIHPPNLRLQLPQTTRATRRLDAAFRSWARVG